MWDEIIGLGMFAVAVLVLGISFLCIHIQTVRDNAKASARRDTTPVLVRVK